MNNKNMVPSSSRRGFLKHAAAFTASSFIILDGPQVVGRGNSSEGQGDARVGEAKPRLNCAETVLSRASEVHGLDFSPEQRDFAAAFGGGMGIGDTCGTVSGSLMVLGYLFRPETGPDTPAREIAGEFIKEFKARLDSLDCRDLKPAYRTEAGGCETVISAAMEILDSTIKRHEEKRTR